MIDIKLTSDPLNLADTNQLVTDDRCGGIVHFVGNVRSMTQGKQVQRLEFEAYRPMAIKEMTKIAEAILKLWPVKKIAIHHRTGILEIGETAVIIAVSCPHRLQAFRACQYAIDTLKETVPIWKKEIFTDGDVWVAAHP